VHFYSTGKKSFRHFRSDSNDDVTTYTLLAESEATMHSWIEAIEAEAVKNRRGSRKSVSARNRSPSIQSPKTKIRKGSAG
jgi:hypothetical protein